MALKIAVKAMATMPVSVTYNGKLKTVTVTKPVSVTCSGYVKKPNDVADRRNGHRYRGRLLFLLYALCYVLIFVGGCASLQKEKVLAVVDGEPITEGDLEYSLTISHRKEDLSSAGTLNLSRYVQKLIDDRLIIDDARRTGIDQYPEIKQAIQAYSLRESVVRLHDEEIVKKVSVSEKDIADYYRINFERFTLGLIEVGSEEEAKDLLEQLKKRGNFKELAQKYSTHPSKKDGGEIVLKRISLSTYIMEAVSYLKPDEFSDVIKIMDKYYIVKLISRKDAPDDELERDRNNIETAIRKQKEKERSDEYLKFLRDRSTIKIDQEVLSSVNLSGGAEKIEEWSKNKRTLAEINDSVLTVGDFVTIAIPYTRKSNVDILNSWIDRKIIDHEALSRHYENNPDLKKMIYRYENQLLKNAFVKKVIIPGIVISDKRLEEYYSSHQNSFINPAQYRIQQITVKTMDEAQDILNNLQNDADFSWLAKRRSVDSAASKGGDAGWLTKTELPAPVREIIDTFKIGDISPIIRIDSLYRITRLQAKTEEGFKEFNEVKDAVYKACFDEQLNTVLDKYVKQLKTDAQIKIYDEEVRSLEEKLQR
jgi:peptidyl-prolyl cis-trans isomerase C